MHTCLLQCVVLCAKIDAQIITKFSSEFRLADLHEEKDELRVSRIDK